MHTIHGSTLIAPSDILRCPVCAGFVALVRLPGGARAWECQAPCGNVCMPGTLLPEPCDACGGEHDTRRCPDLRAMRSSVHDADIPQPAAAGA